MARKKLAMPTPDNAFKDGCLKLDVAKALVSHHNQTLKVKLKGAPDGRVLETDNEQVIDLEPMLGKCEEFLLIKNGELVRASIPVRWL